MLCGMDAPLPPLAVDVIQRVYRFAMVLQSTEKEIADIQAAVLITMEEAFALLDCATCGPWQLGVWAPNRLGGQARTARFDLALVPRPGLLWARLFGVSLIIESDVSSTT